MRRPRIEMAMFSLTVGLSLVGCSDQHNDRNAGAPPPLKVEGAADPNVFQVDHPDKFPLAEAAERVTTSQLTATATVSPDVSRTVPVVSLARAALWRSKLAWATQSRRGKSFCGSKVRIFRELFPTIKRPWPTSNLLVLN